MRIMVFGAGAIGGVLGAFLSRKNEVVLVTRGEHLKRIEEDGLRIHGLMNGNFPLNARDSPPRFAKYDLIVITTKAYDTKAAVESCSGRLKRKGAVLSVQNGIGNLGMLTRGFGDRRSVAGVTSMAAHRTAPGEINYVAEGGITIGSRSPLDRPLKIVESAFKDSGIAIGRTDNIEGVVWEKAIVNSAINTLTAVFNCRNGLVAENPILEVQADRICKEGRAVAESLGIVLEPTDVCRHVHEIAQKTSANKSSMLKDIESKRKTEVDQICLPILEWAKRKGIETPALKRIYVIVKYLESRDELLRKLNMQT